MTKIEKECLLKQFFVVNIDSTLTKTNSQTENEGLRTKSSIYFLCTFVFNSIIDIKF